MTEHRYLYFPGCKITPFLPDYDRETRAVLAALDVSLIDMELNCCGYPVRQIDFTAAVHSGARILAVALKRGLPILTPCKCCYGNLKQADFWMRKNTALRQRINELLKTEELKWSADVVVRHLLTALTEDVTLDRLAAAITAPLPGVRLAAHYGCHALRPGDVTQFDNPMAPTIFEAVLATTGATPVQWPLRLDCCGQPLWDANRNLSLSLMERKLKDAHESGAQAIITACTYCQMQFGQVRDEYLRGLGAHLRLPALHVSRLLAATMGLLPANEAQKTLHFREQVG